MSLAPGRKSSYGGEMRKLLVVWLVFGIGGCSHGPLSGLFQEPVKLRLVPKVGETERYRYVSHSLTETYIDGKLERKKREDVTFVVDSTPLEVDAVNNRIKVLSTTVEQDGAAELRDFAMPALNEKLVMIIDDRTNVFSAGNYPKDSIFFVPSLSLPEKPVKPGDTWEMVSEWRTFQGVPLRMELVSVFKDVVPCGREQKCADIEVSGDVQILNTSGEMRFRSELSGRYLFSINRGLVLWSLVRSDQEIATVNDRIAVTNCMLSRLEKPEEYLWDKIVANECEPADKVPEKLADAIKLRVEG